MNEEIFPHSLFGYIYFLFFFIGQDSFKKCHNSIYKPEINLDTYYIIERKKHTTFASLVENNKCRSSALGITFVFIVFKK